MVSSNLHETRTDAFENENESKQTKKLNNLPIGLTCAGR